MSTTTGFGMGRLPLRDELFLLAHDDGGRTLIHRPSLAVGLAGALLIDLALADRVALGQGYVGLNPVPGSGDPVADWALAGLAAMPRPRPLSDAIRMVAADAYDHVGAGLYAAGLLTRATRRRLGLVRATGYRVTDSAVLTRVRARARYAVQGVEAVTEQSDAFAALLRVLRLGSELYLSLSAGELDQRIASMVERLGRQRPHLKEVIDTVDTLIGDTATAVYR